MQSNRFDTSALTRALIGFDRLFDAVPTPGGNYPPYNIIKTGENDYSVEVAVTGFSKDEITVTTDRDRLVIAAKSTRKEDPDAVYCYRGLAARDFERHFTLMDHARVTGASIANGLLRVSITRVVPEELKPQTIEITE